MVQTSAMASYMSLCGNEITNSERLKRYVDHGIAPARFQVKCAGCEGLQDIIPGLEIVIGDYQLPELDPAPWYDPLEPESANFAGLYVTDVTVSAPYSRTVTPNIGPGQTLGRLKKDGRTIVVTGWLIGKSCCAVQYGLDWLTKALGDQPCVNGDCGMCGGCTLEFLHCCPNISADDECLTTVDEDGVPTVFIRPAGDTEFQRGSDFFRHMNGVGVIDGPNILTCRGSNCGCGSCGQIVEVQFTLVTKDSYFNSTGELLVDAEPPPECTPESPCDIRWVQNDGLPCLSGCAEPPDCLDDPHCPSPALPPSSGLVLPRGCGCLQFQSARVCSSAIPSNAWNFSTINFDVFAGSTDIRNVTIRGWENPTLHDCGDRDFFPDCDSVFELTVSFVPANGTLHFSGEQRLVTIECGTTIKNGFQSVSSPVGAPFDWPDMRNIPLCLCVSFDCGNINPDATVTITRVDRNI